LDSRVCGSPHAPIEAPRSHPVLLHVWVPSFDFRHRSSHKQICHRMRQFGSGGRIFVGGNSRTVTLRTITPNKEDRVNCTYWFHSPARFVKLRDTSTNLIRTILSLSHLEHHFEKYTRWHTLFTQAPIQTCHLEALVDAFPDALCYQPPSIMRAG
jgi:hypothetical protein